MGWGRSRGSSRTGGGCSVRARSIERSRYGSRSSGAAMDAAAGLLADGDCFGHSERSLIDGRAIDGPSRFVFGAAGWGICRTPGAINRIGTESFTHMDGVPWIEDARHWVSREQRARFVAIPLPALRRNRTPGRQAFAWAGDPPNDAGRSRTAGAPRARAANRLSAPASIVDLLQHLGSVQARSASGCDVRWPPRGWPCRRSEDQVRPRRPPVDDRRIRALYRLGHTLDVIAALPGGTGVVKLS